MVVGGCFCSHDAMNEHLFVKDTSKNLFHESTKYAFRYFLIICSDAHFAEYSVKAQFDCSGYTHVIYITGQCLRNHTVV